MPDAISIIQKKRIEDAPDEERQPFLESVCLYSQKIIAYYI